MSKGKTIALWIVSVLLAAAFLAVSAAFGVVFVGLRRPSRPGAYADLVSSVASANA